jgi:hypothetical protein
MDDRALLRRDYLLKKAGWQAAAVVGLVVAVTLAIVAAGSWLVWRSFQICDEAPCARSGQPDIVIGLVLLLLPGGGAVLGGWLFVTSVRKSEGLPYVPPALEQPPLPPAETLLRGADQVDAAGAESLRAANATGNGPPDNLLRSQP